MAILLFVRCGVLLARGRAILHTGHPNLVDGLRAQIDVKPEDCSNADLWHMIAGGFRERGEQIQADKVKAHLEIEHVQLEIE